MSRAEVQVCVITQQSIKQKTGRVVSIRPKNKYTQKKQKLDKKEKRDRRLGVRVSVKNNTMS